MIVYHGSYCAVEHPEIKYSRKNLDFGQGFYVTTIHDQAIGWANRFKIRYKHAIINQYELDFKCLKMNYKLRDFSRYNMEWLDFIIACRGGSMEYLNYDTVRGGIANDRVYNTIELYMDRLIDKKEALKRLKYYKPNEQICMINQKMLEECLHFTKYTEV